MLSLERGLRAVGLRSVLFEDVARQGLLQVADVGVAAELLGERLVAPGQPELELAVVVERSGRFDGEERDRAVGQGEVFPLLARQALRILDDEPAVGEHPFVAEDAEGCFELFAVVEDGVVFLADGVEVDACGVAEKVVDDAHGIL